MDLAILGIKVDAEGSITGLGRFTAAAERAERAGLGVEKMAELAKKAMLGLGLVFGAEQLFHHFIHESEQAQYSQAQLIAGLKSTGGQAHVTLGELNELAEGLQRTTSNSHVATEGVESMLLTFTKIKGDTFREATVAVEDLAARMGGDLRGAAIQVGKALQDPERGVTALRRVGVSFSEAQREQIKNFVETGQAAKAQALILHELGLEFGGSAAAARNTLGGSLRGLRNDFNDLFEADPGQTRGLVSIIQFLDKHLAALVKTLTFAALTWGSYNVVVAVTNAIEKVQALLSGEAAAEKAKEAKATADAAAQEDAMRAALLGVVSAAEQVVAALGEVVLVAHRVAAAVAEAGGSASELAVANTEATVATEEMAASAGVAAAEAAALASASVEAAAATGALSAAEAAEAKAAIAAAGATIALAEGEGAAAVGAAELAAGETEAAATTGILAVATRGLISVLTGPVGIAIALASVVAMLFSYSSSVEDATMASDKFKTSLIGLSLEDLHRQENDLSRAIASTSADIDKMRAQGEAVTKVRVSWNQPEIFVPRPEFTERIDHLTELQDHLKSVQQAEERLRNLPPDGGDGLSKAARARLKAIEDVRYALAQLVRDAEQQEHLSHLQGDSAREEQMRLEAGNQLLKIRHDLQGKVTEGTIMQSDADRLDGEAATAVAKALQLQLQAMREIATVQARQKAEDTTRDQQQQIELTARYGIAQESLRVHFKAVNDEIRARRDLTGDALQITLDSIHAEEQFGQRMLYVQRLANDIQQTFADAFQKILDGGLQSFGDLFSGIKEMFERMLVEMETDKLMRVLADKLGAVLNHLFSGMGATGAGTSAVPVAASAGLAGWAASFGEHQEYGTGQSGTLTLPPIVATAKSGAARDREMMQKFAGYLGAAMIGASLGQMFGYSSGSATIGALAGGLSGAASGFMMAGPVGGIIGGIAGLGAGILGAHKKQQEMERLRNEVLNKNTAKLDQMRESINGSPLLSGKNLTPFASLAKALAGGAGGTQYSGTSINALLQAAVNASNVSKALKGGESSADLRRIEQQFGISFQELGRAAQQLGIELFDANGKLVRGALGQLAEALQLSIKAATEFGNNLDDIQKRQEARNALFNLDSPQQKLNDTYEILEKLAPDLLKQMGLANLNLDTEAGRNVLLQGLRDIFNLIDSGQLTPEMLGAFTDKGQLIDAILAAKEGLDAFKDSLSDVTTDFPKAMDLILYEQARGRGVPADQPTPGASTPPDTTAPRVPQPPTDAGAAAPTNSGGVQVTAGSFFGGVTIVSYGGESGDELLERMETAAVERYGRGGVIYLPGVVTEAR